MKKFEIKEVETVKTTAALYACWDLPLGLLAVVDGPSPIPEERPRASLLRPSH